MKNEESTLNYFSILGVSEDASLDEIESRYQELAAYLSSPDLPEQLREWAAKQSVLVDEAYAVLLDPDRRAAAAGGEVSPEPTEEPAAETTAPAERATPRARAAETRRTSESPRRGVSPLAVGILGGVAVVVLFFGAQWLLGGGDDDEATPTEQAGVPLDTKRIKELISLAEKDPTNVEVLFELGESFFQANQFEDSITWFNRLLAVDPNNVHARNDIGTSHYNMGRPEEAKKVWLEALKLAPDDPQLHWNMGFYYFNQEPRDVENARREWDVVVKLDPNSELAQIAVAHLEALDGPSATPGTTPPPATTATPGATTGATP